LSEKCGNLSGPVTFVECHDEVPAAYPIASNIISTTSSMRGHLAHPTKKLKIGCLVNSFHGKRQNLLDVLATWAQDCDKVYPLTHRSRKVAELGFQTIEVHADGGESYSNIWNKFQKMWKHMQNLWTADELDFLLVGGDDTFFIMPNIRAFLEDKSSTEPVVLGNVQGSFVSGAGYVVNRPAADVLSKCVGGEYDKKTSAEDVMASVCLRSHNVDHPSKAAQASSGRFCAFGICNVHPSVLLYHYISGENMYELYNAVHGDVATRRTRMCASSLRALPPQITEGEAAMPSSGWAPRWVVQ